MVTTISENNHARFTLYARVRKRHFSFEIKEATIFDPSRFSLLSLSATVKARCGVDLKKRNDSLFSNGVTFNCNCTFVRRASRPVVV